MTCCMRLILGFDVSLRNPLVGALPNCVTELGRSMDLVSPISLFFNVEAPCNCGSVGKDDDRASSVVGIGNCGSSNSGSVWKKMPEPLGADGGPSASCNVV